MTGTGGGAGVAAEKEGEAETEITGETGIEIEKGSITRSTFDVQQIV